MRPSRATEDCVRPPAWEPDLKAPCARAALPGLFFDPRTGKEHPIGEVTPDTEGSWTSPITPTFEQWVIVLEKKI
jgi:hypothetical protein